MAVLRKIKHNDIEYSVNISASTEYKFVAEFGETLDDFFKEKDQIKLKNKSIQLCYICLKNGNNPHLNTDSFEDFLDCFSFVDLINLSYKVVEKYFETTKPINQQKVQHKKKHKKGK